MGSLATTGAGCVTVSVSTSSRVACTDPAIFFSNEVKIKVDPSVDYLSIPGVNNF